MKLKLDWFSIKPREYMARLEDNTLLRIWQTRNGDQTFTWFCYHGSLYVGTAASLEEAKSKTLEGKRAAALTESELDRVAADNEKAPRSPAKTRAGGTPARPAERPARMGGKATLDHGQTITVLARDNPKKADAGRRFGLYSSCRTIADYVAAVGDLKKAEADVKWDTKQGFIKLGAAK